MRQKTSHWIPAAFCAILSLTALSASTGSDAGWWRPAFLAFLPMCFFFVGATTSGMQREIRDLQKQVAETQQRRVGRGGIAEPDAGDQPPPSLSA